MNIRRKNGILLIKNNNIERIFLKDKQIGKLNNIFKNIKVHEAELVLVDEKIKGTFIEFYDNEYIDDIFSILTQRSSDDFYQIFEDLSELFFTYNGVLFKKIRGDLGEALYSYFYNGKRTLNDLDTYDFYSEENELVEIKTYSQQKKVITISHQQLQQNVKVFIVPIEADNNGKTIVEIASELKDKNFGLMLKNKYQNTPKDKQRYKLNKPIEYKITDELKFPLPKKINNANKPG